MSKLVWGEGPPALHDLGYDFGVLYLAESAEVWDGLVSVDEKQSKEDRSHHHFEGAGYFKAEIKAYTFPDSFLKCNGYLNEECRKPFGLSYRFLDQIHLIYNAQVEYDKSNLSIFRWGIEAATVQVPRSKPTAHLILEDPGHSDIFERLQGILYGTDTTEPRLPTPVEIIELYRKG